MSPYEERARERMAAAVTRALHVHPRMPPGARRLTVEHTSGCIWVVAEIEGREILARVHDCAWWEPRLRTVEDQAEEVAGRLVRELAGT